ncbi:hypothetical protein RA27_20255 [Ruegeria sp. ANG-R]|uniref:DUF1127 domain-containing protein n=1 Tax=Ruegeria sp. ANG-R TaxID=1577903 RepID=UPI00057C4559|nr:DUF1127 domain-containing protein [Ruegeria sp. ANG-R]KIC38748.1 hypothetical protein RA27_20255 [Ruegeria sp. ANG-R]
MLDANTPPNQNPSTNALLLFDRAMKMRAIRADIVCAAQELNRLPDTDLSELGINRSDVEAVIAQYI